MPIAFYLYAVTTLVLTANALRRPSPRSRIPTWWLPAMVVSELAGLLLVVRLALGLGFWVVGGWEGLIGRLGGALWMMSVIGLVLIIYLTRRTVQQLHAEVAPEHWVSGSLWGLVQNSLPGDLELMNRIAYAPDLTLDAYRSRSHNGELSPTLVYVHGGGWTGGDPHRQARTMFHHLAQRGWVVLTIRYPLAPAATFPAQLIAVHQAVGWAKSAGLELGVDPERVVLSGGSAGGHLASLAALTAAEEASVAACVPIYGVYDFLNRNRTRPDWPVIPRAVMKALPEEAPDAYRLASPLDQIHRGAPPFLVVHGANDSLVPPLEARQFVERLTAVSEASVRYLEVGGAQHAFDAIHSPRTRAVVASITEFLEANVVSFEA